MAYHGLESSRKHFHGRATMLSLTMQWEKKKTNKTKQPKHSTPLEEIRHKSLRELHPYFTASRFCSAVSSSACRPIPGKKSHIRSFQKTNSKSYSQNLMLAPHKLISKAIISKFLCHRWLQYSSIPNFYVKFYSTSLPSSLPHFPFLTLATLSGREAIAFPHTQWKWQCHQLDATPNSLYKLSWAGTISVARSRWLIEAQASRWLLGEKWSISQQEEWAGEGKQALREQKLHWCERAAQLPAAGASLNIHISNNLELYVVQTGRVTSR